jgi:IclR family pca regulon transcriptional regulator
MVQVIERVGALLGAFSHGESELSLIECAERSGLSKSTTHRLLVAMAEIGLVERIGNANWRIGGFVVQLATMRLANTDLHSEVAPAVHRLGKQFGAATALSVPNGSEMVYIERTESPLPFAPAAKLGSTAPFWAGASGRAVASSLSAEALSALLKSATFTALPKDARSRVEADIEETRSRGYSIDPGDFIDGVAGVAVALGRSGDPVAAISLLVSPDRMTPDLTRQMGEALVGIAKHAVSTNYLLSAG